MKLYTNKVSTGKGITWNDFVAKSANQNSDETIVKTASTEADEAPSTEADEAPSSGQLDVEPLHQQGESEKPSAVNDKNKKVEAEVKEAKLEADEVVEYDGGKTEAKLVNQPEVEDEKEAEANVEVKEARNQDGTGPAGEGPGTGRGLGKCTDEEKKEQKEKDDDDDDKDDKDDGDDGLTAAQKKLPEALQEAIKKKKSSGQPLYIKVANLDDKSKQVMRAYWGKVWPEEFINAVLAEK